MKILRKDKLAGHNTTRYFLQGISTEPTRCSTERLLALAFTSLRYPSKRTHTCKSVRNHLRVAKGTTNLKTQQAFLSEIYDEFVEEGKWETKNWKLVLTIGGMAFKSKNKNSKGQVQQVSLNVSEN